MLADIFSSNNGTADTFFLIAAILFGIVALTHLIGYREYGAPVADGRRGVAWAPIGGLFMAAGLCLTAIGLMFL